MNAVSTIQDTLTSARSQKFRDFEHIVIDGASTDGTIDLIASQTDEIAFWSSEPDRGIADAMNRGLSKARGQYVLFLHADDYLADKDALARAAPHLAGNADIYAFDILFSTAVGTRRRRPRGATWYLNFKTGFFHQAVLCRRDLFARVGAFDTQYAITMDYDFFLRAVRAGATVVRVPEILSVTRDTGVSSRKDWSSLRQRFDEERRVHRQICTTASMAIIYGIYWILYMPYRWSKAAISQISKYTGGDQPTVLGA
jgi:glycosyltransferase involved in cell wall biosynthesis